MVLTRDWHPPVRVMGLMMLSAGVRLFIAAGLALVPLPIPDVDVAVVESVRWGLVTLLFLLSLIPLTQFLWVAFKNARFPTFQVAEGVAYAGADRPEPPFTPSAPKRWLRWVWVEGSLPSCRVWVLRKPERGPGADRHRVVILLGAMERPGMPTVEAAKRKLRRYLLRHPRPVGPGA